MPTNSAPIVQRLGHLTVDEDTGVRFSLGAPTIINNGNKMKKQFKTFETNEDFVDWQKNINVSILSITPVVVNIKEQISEDSPTPFYYKPKITVFVVYTNYEEQIPF